MWYGSNSTHSYARYEQAKEAENVIKSLGLNSDTKFKELKQIGINNIMAARIIHLLHNDEFWRPLDD